LSFQPNVNQILSYLIVCSLNLCRHRHRFNPDKKLAHALKAKVTANTNPKAKAKTKAKAKAQEKAKATVKAKAQEKAKAKAKEKAKSKEKAKATAKAKAKATAQAKCKSKSNRKSKRKSKSKSKSKRLSIVTHELDPTPAVGSNPTPGDFWVEIFGVGCLPTPGIKSPVWDPTPRILVWDSKREDEFVRRR